MPGDTIEGLAAGTFPRGAHNCKEGGVGGIEVEELMFVGRTVPGEPKAGSLITAWEVLGASVDAALVAAVLALFLAFRPDGAACGWRGLRRRGIQNFRSLLLFASHDSNDELETEQKIGKGD